MTTKSLRSLFAGPPVTRPTSQRGSHPLRPAALDGRSTRRPPTCPTSTTTTCTTLGRRSWASPPCSPTLWDGSEPGRRSIGGTATSTSAWTAARAAPRRTRRSRRWWSGPASPSTPSTPSTRSTQSTPTTPTTPITLITPITPITLSSARRSRTRTTIWALRTTSATSPTTCWTRRRRLTWTLSLRTSRLSSADQRSRLIILSPIPFPTLPLRSRQSTTTLFTSWSSPATPPTGRIWSTPTCTATPAPPAVSQSTAAASLQAPSLSRTRSRVWQGGDPRARPLSVRGPKALKTTWRAQIWRGSESAWGRDISSARSALMVSTATRFTWRRAASSPASPGRTK